MAQGEGSARAPRGHVQAASSADAERNRREVEAAIPAFDAVTQMVVRAVLLEGRSEDEVASTLGVTPWSVARKLARFRAALLRPLAVALAAGALSGCGTTPLGAAPEVAEAQAPRERSAAGLARPPADGARRAPDALPAAEESPTAAAAAAPTPPPDDDVSPGLPAPPADRTAPAAAPWRPSPAEAAAAPVVADVWPDKGPASGCDRVVIRGEHLRPAQVLFGMAPARILSAAEGEVVVAAPPGRAGAVSLALTNGDGGYVVLPAAFRYYD